jgi:hypothetical protein
MLHGRLMHCEAFTTPSPVPSLPPLLVDLRSQERVENGGLMSLPDPPSSSYKKDIRLLEVDRRWRKDSRLTAYPPRRDSLSGG